MRATMALVLWAMMAPTISGVPLPPIIEKLNKEGISIGHKQEERIQGTLGSGSDGAHLFKLLKGQSYRFELASPEFKGRVRIVAVGSNSPAFQSDAAKATYKSEADGTYRLTVSGADGGVGKYILTMKHLDIPDLRPGVLTVGPGGISVNGVLDRNDPMDAVRRHRCKVYEVQMKAGRTYTIDLNSQWDNYLRLENEKQQQLAADDDSGGFPNARIIFRAQADGIYRVITTSFAGAVGNFTLTINGN